MLWLGLSTYVILSFLACYYFKERTAFTDISFHLFELLRTGEMAIQNFRFGAFFTQAFPVLASKAGLPLTQVAILYSLSFVVLPFLLFLMILQWLKQEKIALVLLLFSTLMVTHTFYWTQSELPQGVAFAMLYFAMLTKTIEEERHPDYYFGLVIPLVFLLVFVHPLMIFAVAYALLFLALHYPIERGFVLYNLMGFVLVYFIKTKVFVTEYDSKAMDGLKNVFELLPRFWSLESSQRFFGYLWADYYMLLATFATVSIWYFWQKKWLQLALLWLFSAGFLCIVNATYFQGAHQFYIENQYLLLSLFVIFPFVFDFLPAISSKPWSKVIVPFLLVTGLVRIGTSNDLYSVRIEWLRSFMEKTPDASQRKLVVEASKVPKDTLLLTWGSHFEFWLLSTIETGVTRSIIIEEEKDKYKRAMNKNHSFVSPWGDIEYNTLNPRYFVFPDSISGYTRY
jgi:hypothetical protein